MAGKKTRIRDLIIAKALLDIVVLTAAFAWNAYASLPPRFTGWTDSGPRIVTGWVVDVADPGRVVDVQVFADGQLLWAGKADRSRPDVIAAGKAARENCGFSVLDIK
jgi:hypothetical protein